MTQRLEANGGDTDNPKWDDGSDHDGVTNIYVRGDREGIQFIKFDYVTTGQLKEESLHGFSNQGFTHVFKIDHLKGEYLVSVEAFHNSSVIQGLQFKTNMKVSEIMGYVYRYKFTLAVEGKKIIGFHGSSKSNLNLLGAYVTWITPTRMEAEGGKGGTEWNDGGDYEAVTKIHVCTGRKGLLNIKVDYVDKDGHPKEGLVHGNPHGGATLEPFVINHVDNECLLSADGYYDEASGVIQAIQFKTNMKTSELMGFHEDDEPGIKFSLGCYGNKIIGFHGYADKTLNSLGAYFTSLPIVKLGYNTDSGGLPWDDGTFHGVRKVCVYYSATSMCCVRFEYDNGGKVGTRGHGTIDLYKIKEGEFVLDYPNELLTSVEGTSIPFGYEKLITSLTFKTSKGRTSPTFGNEFGREVVQFKHEQKGCAVVGFHGWSTYEALHSLGAYFSPMIPPQDGEN